MKKDEKSKASHELRSSNTSKEEKSKAAKEMAGKRKSK